MIFQSFITKIKGLTLSSWHYFTLYCTLAHFTRNVFTLWRNPHFEYLKQIIVCLKVQVFHSPPVDEMV